jgi:hypothetical protein
MIDYRPYVTVAYRFVCTHMIFKYRNQIQIKSKDKCKSFHGVSAPKFRALSTGALLFAISLILCTGKWIELFRENEDLAFNLNFQHIGLNLRENQVHHSKERQTV